MIFVSTCHGLVCLGQFGGPSYPPLFLSAHTGSACWATWKFKSLCFCRFLWKTCSHTALLPLSGSTSMVDILALAVTTTCILRWFFRVFRFFVWFGFLACICSGTVPGPCRTSMAPTGTCWAACTPHSIVACSLQNVS